MGPGGGSGRKRSVIERLTFSDPMHRLSINIFCDHPDVKDLTVEQQLALHEFFHRVLADGYKLYQIVPPRLAAPIIKKKFGLIIKEEPLPSPNDKA